MEAPHPTYPFTLTRDGTQVAEQGSEANIVSNVNNIVRCPEGFRAELPEYGLPEMLYGIMPPDPTPIEEAIHQWEPECDLELQAQRQAVGEALVTVAVGE